MNLNESLNRIWGLSDANFLSPHTVCMEQLQTQYMAQSSQTLVHQEPLGEVRSGQRVLEESGGYGGWMASREHWCLL